MGKQLMLYFILMHVMMPSSFDASAFKNQPSCIVVTQLHDVHKDSVQPVSIDRLHDPMHPFNREYDGDFNQTAFAYQYQSELCKQYYGMELSQVLTILQYKHDQFYIHVLKNDAFSLDIKKKLWKIYATKCWRIKESYKRLERNVSNYFAQQDKKIQTLEQLQQASKRQHEKKVFDSKQSRSLKQATQVNALLHQANFDDFCMQNLDCASACMMYESCLNISHNQQKQQRISACEKTLKQKGLKFEQKHTLSLQASGFLYSLNQSLMPYELMYGTALQQQIHNEVCQNLNYVACYKNQKNSPHEFLDQIVYSNQVAMLANHAESMLIAMNLSDLAQAGIKIYEEFSSCAVAAMQGVLQGIVSTAETIGHPIQACKDFASSLFWLVETICLQNPELCQEYPEFNQIRIARNAMIKNACNSWVADTSRSEKITQVTRMVVEGFLLGKLCTIVSGFISKIPLVPSESSYQLSTVAHGMVDAEVHTHASTILKNCTFNALTEGKVFGSEIVHKMIVANPALIEHEFVKLITAHAGKIVLTDVELCAKIKKIFPEYMHTLHGPKDSSFLKKSLSKIIETPTGKKKINLDIKHITEIEYKIVENINTGLLEIDFAGGHVSGLWEMLEHIGMVEIVNKTVLPGGAYKLDILNKSSGKMLEKTIFPESWDYKKITQACWYVYENQIVKDQVAVAPKYARRGIYQDVIFEIILKHHDQGTNIVTTRIVI